MQMIFEMNPIYIEIIPVFTMAGDFGRSWKRLYNFLRKLFYFGKRFYICNRR